MIGFAKQSLFFATESEFSAAATEPKAAAAGNVQLRS
jgi:hypothetical protein